MPLPFPTRWLTTFSRYLPPFARPSGAVRSRPTGSSRRFIVCVAPPQTSGRPSTWDVITMGERLRRYPLPVNHWSPVHFAQHLRTFFHGNCAEGYEPSKFRRSPQSLIDLLSARLITRTALCNRRPCLGARPSWLHNLSRICLRNIVNPGPLHRRALAASEVLRLGAESITPYPIKVRGSLAYTTVIS